jgi:hypothetical protein
MVINHKKSGIMHVDCKRTKDKEIGWESHRGFPIVKQYRYLGGILSRDFKTVHHLRGICRKIAFLAAKLTPIRMLKDIRLSVNLFRTLCMPLVRMGLVNTLMTTKTDQNLYLGIIRAKFKTFCLLPKCTPNKLINALLGNVSELSQQTAVKAMENLRKDGKWEC